MHPVWGGCTQQEVQVVTTRTPNSRPTFQHFSVWSGSPAVSVTTNWAPSFHLCQDTSGQFKPFPWRPQKGILIRTMMFSNADRAVFAPTPNQSKNTVLTWEKMENSKWTKIKLNIKSLLICVFAEIYLANMYCGDWFVFPSHEIKSLDCKKQQKLKLSTSVWTRGLFTTVPCFWFTQSQSEIQKLNVTANSCRRSSLTSVCSIYTSCLYWTHNFMLLSVLLHWIRLKTD